MLPGGLSKISTSPYNTRATCALMVRRTIMTVQDVQLRGITQCSCWVGSYSRRSPNYSFSEEPRDTTRRKHATTFDSDYSSGWSHGIRRVASTYEPPRGGRR